MLFILIAFIILSVAGLTSCTGNYYINKDKLNDSTMSNKPYYKKRMKVYNFAIKFWFVVIIIMCITFLVLTENLDMPVWK